MKKILLMITGCLSLGLGAIGTVIPLLPTVPFLLLAAFCFTSSSERLSNWFTGTKLYQKHLEGYVKGRGMTIGTKLRIIISVTVFMGLGFIMMSGTLVGRVVLTVVWVCHMVYFLLLVKTNRD